MRIVNSNVARLLVWLAAALMPVNVVWAGTCGCGEQNAGNPPVKSVKNYQTCACCCHGGAVCQCCHRAQKAHKSACCKTKISQPVSSTGAFSPICVCPGKQAPAPLIPLADSSAAKQSIGHACACIAPPAIVGLSDHASHFNGQCPSLPATPLERLSTLCRLII